MAAEEPSYQVPHHSGGMAAPANPTGLFAIAEEISKERIEEYARVARVAIGAIRSVDPQRPIVCDGCGTYTVPDLIDAGAIQSCHDYLPMQLTLHEAEWLPQPPPRRTTRLRLSSAPPQKNPGLAGMSFTGPGLDWTGHWPIKNQHNTGRDPRNPVVFGRDNIERGMGRWQRLEQQGVGIHFGETGCYKYTPHGTVLGWMNDTLEVMGKMHSGWALRNFRGPFGVLDTERAGTKFEDWHGHQLDRALLNLLQKKMRA